MGVEEAHPKVFSHARERVAPSDYNGRTVAIDIASWKLRFFWADAPDYFRPDRATPRGWMASLAQLLSAWTAGCGGEERVLVVLDGAKFPPKAREHARRGAQGEPWLDRLAAAADKDRQGETAAADKAYAALSYPPPPSVDAWLLAHCKENKIPVIVAPFEADSQCARLALAGAVDAIVTFDGDLSFYSGVNEVVYQDSGKGKGGVYWRVMTSDLCDTTLGPLDLHGLTAFDLQTVAGAVGTDYCSRVYGCGWPTVVGWLRSLVSSASPFGSEALRERFIAHAAAENARRPGDKRRVDYEPSLRATYAAFADPVAWMPAAGGAAPKDWLAGPSAISLVGATRVCYDSAAQPHPDARHVVEADAAAALKLCRGDVHARARQIDCLEDERCNVLDARALPELDAATDSGDAAQAHMPTLRPDDRGTPADRSRLNKFTIPQLFNWLTDKLGSPVASEVRSSKPLLVECVATVLEIIEREGDSHFRSMSATMGALHSWTVDLPNFERRVTEGITGSEAVYAYLKERLPTIDDDMRNRYMPLGFKSTYERSFAHFAGGACKLESLRVLPSRYTKDGVALEAFTVTADIGASMREGGNKMWTTTLGFVARAHSGGWVLHSPVSECGCECGVCCAHGLDLLHVLYVLQRSADYTSFVEGMGASAAWTKEHSVSSRVIFWETILYLSQSHIKARAVASTLAAAGAAAAGASGGAAALFGGIAAAAVAAAQGSRRGRRARDQSIDERLQEAMLAGDILRDSATGEVPQLYGPRGDGKFGDALFWRRLDALYRRKNPVFNNPNVPMYHYYLWYQQSDEARRVRDARVQAAAERQARRVAARAARRAADAEVVPLAGGATTASRAASPVQAEAEADPMVAEEEAPARAPAGEEQEEVQGPEAAVQPAPAMAAVVAARSAAELGDPQARMAAMVFAFGGLASPSGGQQQQQQQQKRRQEESPAAPSPQQPLEQPEAAPDGAPAAARPARRLSVRRRLHPLHPPQPPPQLAPSEAGGVAYVQPSPIQGFGLYASRDIQAGETVAGFWRGVEADAAAWEVHRAAGGLPYWSGIRSGRDASVTYDADWYSMDSRPSWTYLNHAPGPNAEMLLSSRPQIRFVAKQWIPAHTEICIAYGDDPTA